MREEIKGNWSLPSAPAAVPSGSLSEARRRGRRLERFFEGGVRPITPHVTLQLLAYAAVKQQRHR